MTFLNYFRLSSRSQRQYALYLASVLPAGTGGINFTAAEQDTGLKWTDGSTIYQKTIAISAGPGLGATVNTAHGISGLSTLVKVDPLLRGASGTWHLLSIVSTTGATLQCVVRVDATNVILIAGAGGDYSTYTGHVTLYYTKA
jgi:hypothetical protein